MRILPPCLALACLLTAVPVAAAEPPEGYDPTGLLYGTVTTADGDVYRGRLRWSDEEAAWGDFFNTTKEELPWARVVPRDERYRREPIEILGIKIGMRWEERTDGRQLIARFGDVDRIEVRGSDRIRLVMKTGTVFEAEGGSNDVGATVWVWDEGLGKLELAWRNLERIDFAPTPKDLATDVYRLRGTVETEAGTFEGFVQWDLEECMSDDKLDGDTADGRLAIPMGNIQSIEKRSRSSSRVTLHDGRTLVLDGTNDVDDDNRGIMVEDPRWGRVDISWDAFVRVDFERAPTSSGPSYDSFRAPSSLHGSVTTADGEVRRGRLVWDVDEAEGWELLNGRRRGIEYNVPFAMVAAVERRTWGARVTLVGGETVDLEDSSDVDEGHAGIVVIADGERWVSWDDVDRVDFDHER